MRSDTAARQASALEKVAAKVFVRLGIGGDVTADEEIATGISDALLEAYSLGAIEAVQQVPWETTEVAYRHRAAPDDMAPMTRQGWEPWMVSETMVPKHAAQAKGGEMVKAYLVRFKRRIAPTAPAIT